MSHPARRPLAAAALLAALALLPLAAWAGKGGSVDDSNPPTEDIGPQPPGADGMYPSSAWRLGWPMGKKYDGCEEIAGLYHATSVKKIGDHKYEWTYEWNEEAEMLDWLEIDGWGEKGYPEIRGGKLCGSGREQPDTVLRTCYYLNAVFKVKDVEIEFQTHAAGDRGGITLTNIMACPVGDMMGTPSEWGCEKYKYPDTSTHFGFIDGARMWVSSGTFQGSGGGKHPADRHVKMTWSGPTITFTCNSHTITREGKENVPKNQDRDMCIIGFGCGGKKGLNGELHTYDWVKVRGTLNLAWLHKTQKYGLPPKINCARSASGGGARHGSMNYQSGSRMVRTHRNQVGGPEGQWKWLKANTTNYLYYSHGIQDDEWEKIKAGGPLPKSVP